MRQPVDPNAPAQLDRLGRVAVEVEERDRRVGVPLLVGNLDGGVLGSDDDVANARGLAVPGWRGGELVGLELRAEPDAVLVIGHGRHARIAARPTAGRTARPARRRPAPSPCPTPDPLEDAPAGLLVALGPLQPSAHITFASDVQVRSDNDIHQFAEEAAELAAREFLRGLCGEDDEDVLG
jgi:hypothetical protein